MLCHDYATVICCDRCSFELQIDGNYQRRTMNRIAKKQGWRIGKQDICPFCIEREKRSVRKDGNEFLLNDIVREPCIVDKRKEGDYA